jgi:hypothetical protein
MKPPDRNAIADALRPLAGLGVPPVRDFPPWQNLEVPFSGRGGTETLFDDDFGHRLTVADCRRAADVLRRLHDF